MELESESALTNCFFRTIVLGSGINALSLGDLAVDGLPELSKQLKGTVGNT